MKRLALFFVISLATLFAFDRQDVVQDILSQSSVMQYAQDLRADSPVVEEAYQFFVREICSSYPTRRRYALAVSKAAEHLAQKVARAFAQISEHNHYPALLIGINYRGTQQELNGCINDIEHVAETFLQRVLNVNATDIVVMSDDMLGSNLYPTRVNIIEQLRVFCKKVNQAGHGFLHYSGHGSWLRDQSNDEKDRRDETLVPVDFDRGGMLTDDFLFRLLCDNLDPKAKLTVIFDCCHSGSALDLPYRWGRSGQAIVENIAWTSNKELPDIVLLSASHDSQTAAESTTEYGTSGGAMTAAFLQAIRNNPNTLNYAELLDALYGYMKRGGYEQIPQITSTKKLDLSKQFLEKKVVLRP